jgi:hypothetical protein
MTELFEREEMPVDRYIELTSRFGVKKVKWLPLEERSGRQVYKAIQSEAPL